ncbi:major facilitator superfamily domain-containing protein [Sporodiniella umbellata]|nr:major facilitator superfamily domain-containing protein [Sporodiniella umbellata]
MDPVSKVLSNRSTRSYLEREIIVSLDNDGPMIGPTLEAIETTDERNISKDKVDPYQFSRLKKFSILLVVAVAGAMSPIASIIYFPALTTMQKYFDTDETTINASFAIFIFITAFFPLVWATLGDRFGRRNVYLVSFVIAIIGNICCAVSINVEMFNGFRAISAMGSSSVLSMGAGTIADIFEPQERGRAFAIYFFGPLLGPALGPIIGGYLSQGLGWRSNFWFLAIFAFCIWVGIFFLLPETSRMATFPSSLDAIEKKPIKPEIEEDTAKSRFKIKMINPFSPMGLLLYPNIALSTTYIGIVFFLQYLNSTEFTRIYTNQYKLDSGLVGLCYLPFAVGAMTGGSVGGRISDNTYNSRVAKAKERGEDSYPEMRVSGLTLSSSSIIQFLAITAYGWCVQKDVHFGYGLACQFIYGFAFMLPNVMLGAYMVDCFRKKSATVTGCNNLVRYIMAGIGSLVSPSLVKVMGDGPMFTFGGGLVLLFSVNIYFIKRYHKKWSALRKS